VATPPQTRPGRYAELDTGQLADAVEQAYERGEAADWELVFEFARRAMFAEARHAGDVAVGAARQS